MHRLEQLLTEERWRRGVPETSYVLPFLDARCRSLPEAELLAFVVFAGLPMPEVNGRSTLADGTELTPDQRFADYDLVLEYEGSQHQEDRRQYNADIDRYAAYRRNRVPYEQVTKERLRSPKATVRMVHARPGPLRLRRTAARLRRLVAVALHAAPGTSYAPFAPRDPVSGAGGAVAGGPNAPTSTARGRATTRNADERCVNADSSRREIPLAHRSARQYVAQ